MNRTSLRRHLTGIAGAALDYLYPPLHDCPRCGRQDILLDAATAGLCENCYAAFPWLSVKDMPPGVCVPARYEDGARALAARLKYREAQYLAPVMARVMADSFRQVAAEGEWCTDPARWVVVPVPLHRSRQRQRGYNQSALLARHLADMLEFSYSPGALTRHRKTPPLYRLSRQERGAHLAGSMILQADFTKTLHHRQILLVDDIYTTGATAEACREALQPANPAGVTLLAFALAELHHFGIS